MSVTIKSTEMSYKDPNSGNYVGINVLAEKKTSQLIHSIAEAGASERLAIEAKGETVISDIPASYDDLNNIIADSYDSTETYSVGDYVRYYDGTHDKLYRCITDISTAEAWTSSHWTEIVMAYEVSDLKSAFDFYQVKELPRYIVKNEYIKKDGASAGSFVASKGWDRTELIPIYQYHSISFKSSVSSAYNAFYHSDKSFKKVFTVGTTETEFIIPDDVYYVAFSNTKAGMENLVATYTEKDTNEISNLNDEFIDITGCERLTNWNGNKLYIKTDSTSADILNPTPTTASGNARYLVAPCSPGDLFSITTTGGSASRAFAFIKSDGTIISKSVPSISIESLILVAPALSAYLIVNDTSLTGEVYKGILKSLPSVESSTRNNLELVTGYDVFDGTLIWIAGEYIDNTTGETGNDTMYRRTDYIPIKGEYTKLTITASDAGTFVRNCNAFYDSEKNFISNFSFSSNSTVTVIPPTNARFFRLSCSQYISLSVSAYYKTIMDKLNDERTVTTTVIGADIPAGADEKYTLPSNYITAMGNAITAWMSDYAGDDTKVPFILHTDQHGRLNRNNKGVFDLLNYLVNWDGVSAIFNLGDVVVDHWVDDDTNVNPLLRNATLEAALQCVSSIPADKQVNVFGNHDTWYNDGEATIYLPSLKYLNPYFRTTGLRTEKCPDNSGLMIVFDDVRRIKYLVAANWDYSSRSIDNRQYFYTSANHWRWMIGKMTENTGHDLVIVSHVPLLLGSSIAYNPITEASATRTTPERFINKTSSSVSAMFDAIWAARKNKTSGTLTVQNETISYDFTNCTDNCLCALAGHWHDDVVDYCGGNTGILCATFDWFADRTINFGIIDRANSQIKVWKLHNEDDTPGVQTWTAPFTYTE